MFKSLCAFSIALLASATFIELVLWVPALMTEPYSLSIISDEYSDDPDVTFTILSIVFFLSPGFTRSGE